MKQKIAMLALFIFSSVNSFAQEDTINLKAIQIIESSIFLQPEPGQIILKKADEESSQSSLQLLQNSGILFFNLNGLSGLAGQNLRNVGFSRTLVSWNELPLNSPRNGGLDFQLLSGSIGNQLDLFDGGRSSKVGSGAIGGELAISEKSSSREGLHGQLGISVGNFDLFKSRLKLFFRKKFYTGCIKTDYHFANNDFSYKVGQESRKRLNSKIQGYNLVQNNSWELGKKNRLKLNLWWQQYHRELPAGITASYRGDQQDDKNFRMSFSHFLNLKNGGIKSSMGYLHESITFQNELVPPVAGIAQRLQLSTKLIKRIKNNLQYQIGASGTRESNEDFSNPSILFQQLAVKGGLEYSPLKNKFSFFIRQNYIEKADNPITGSIIWESDFSKIIQGYIKFGRDFRYPSINDRFWQGPGGVANPDLLSEISWTQEASVELRNNFFSKKHSMRLTLFSMFVDNWIQWIQIENNLWQAQNLKKVWSRGIKVQAFTTKEFSGNGTLKLECNYQYNPSTTVKTYLGNPSFQDKQVPRSPLHHGGLSLGYHYKKIGARFSQQFSGIRYEDPENTIINPAFYISNIEINYEATLLKNKCQFGLSINNVFNSSYEVIPDFPMPGINGMIDFEYIF